jgi:glutathionylspermidine synthase
LIAGGDAIFVRRAMARDPLSAPTMIRDLAQQYFIFDAYVAGERRVDLHPIILSPAMHWSAVNAAEAVGRLVGRATARAHQDPEEAARYGFEEDTLRLARASHLAGDDASFMRVDLLLDERGTWQACEINADCPGGHNEAFGLPRLARVAGFFEGWNPTTAVSALARRLIELADGDAIALVYATAYAEDLQVCAIIRHALEARGAKTILAPPTALRERNGRLCIGSTPIGALYRFFPTEWMAGQANVPHIARAVETGNLRTMSSFSHVFTQSKLGLARAFASMEDAPRAERALLTKHVPFTTDLVEMAPEMLTFARKGWVIKRAMGRVGDQVFVGALHDDADWREVISDSLAARATGQSWLAQRFVRQRTIPTPWGPRYITLGAYLLDGRFVGYFARITEETHCSFDALCLPVFVASPPRAIDRQAASTNH